jgi:putative glycosyltransferase
MHLSIVTTLYFSENTIEDFCKRMQETVAKVTEDYEIIIVDDGSPDDSYKKAQDMRRENRKIKLIQLSRNYGHHRAIYSGLERAKGDLIFLIDSDLQERPESFVEFYNFLSSTEDIDAVIGVQKTRDKSWLGSASSFYYRIFNKLSDYAYQKEDQMTLRLMKKSLVDAFLQHKDKEIYFAPIFSLAGFNQIYLPQTKNAQQKTTYTLLKRYNIFINAILSFSSKPLYFVFYSGLLTTITSSLFVFYIVLSKFMSNSISSGWSSLMASIWFLGGIIITFIGLVAIYINKIYVEIKDRPLHIIKKLEGFSEEEG